MPDLLLETKLRPPPLRPHLVPRPRLQARLDAGLTTQLTLISAPAGFGKTTLVNDWIHHCGLPTAWITLDEGDNDLARFLAYLAASLQRLDPSLVAAIPERSPARSGAGAEPGHAVELLQRLINDITTQGPERLVLVLDDFHLVNAAPIHDLLGYLLDHQPSNLHLVIATRADPPLPIARLRGRGQVSELRQADLCFSEREATEFLSQFLGLALSPAEVAALFRRTEGWIAGLQMAAASLQAQDPAEAAAFIQDFTGSNRFILDYLLEEVLQRQPPNIQVFLLHTAILDRMCGLLADEVIGGDWAVQAGAQSQPILEHLERANLFVVPLDERRQWYRFHRLFADLLRSRLDQEHPELPPVLHRRASAWFAHNGLLEEAVGHALAARDYEDAARLMEKAAEATLGRSEVATFLRWVEALPDDVLANHPDLRIYQGWAQLMSGRRLADVAVNLRTLEADDDLMRSRSAPLHALAALFQGRIPRATELSRRALDQLPEQESFLRTLALFDLAVTHFARGDLARGRQVLVETVELAKTGGNVLVAVLALSNLAEIELNEGRLRQAETIFRQALDLAVDAGGNRLPISGIALMGLGMVQLEWNHLDEALALLEEGIALSNRWSEMGAMDGYLALGQLRQALGDSDGATEAVEQAAAMMRQWDSSGVYDAAVTLVQAYLWLRQGNLTQVERWLEARQAWRDSRDRVADQPDAASLLDKRVLKYEWLLAANLRLAQGRSGEALALLDLAEPAMRERHRAGRLLEIDILRALAYRSLGEEQVAMDCLQRALLAAEPEGFVRVFVNAGPSLAPLLSQAVRRGIVPPYATALQKAIGAEASAPEGEAVEAKAEPPAAQGQDQLVEPLSERELEVLSLVAEGLTNQEVAQRLVLSLATVKWHTSNIYGKLGVGNRTQAVTRARELGLLELH